MKYQVNQYLAEEIASDLEEARQFGLAWTTFRVKDDRINGVLSTHRYELDARENAAIEGPGVDVALINDLLPELYQVINEAPGLLEQNVRQLDRQFNDLGFHHERLRERLMDFANSDKLEYKIHLKEVYQELTADFWFNWNARPWKDRSP